MGRVCHKKLIPECDKKPSEASSENIRAHAMYARYDREVNTAMDRNQCIQPAHACTVYANKHVAHPEIKWWMLQACGHSRHFCDHRFGVPEEPSKWDKLKAAAKTFVKERRIRVSISGKVKFEYDFTKGTYSGEVKAGDFQLKYDPDSNFFQVNIDGLKLTTTQAKKRAAQALCLYAAMNGADINTCVQMSNSRAAEIFTQ